MTTARMLFHRCRKAGIALAVDGDGIAFDAPPGVVVPVDDLRACKAELLAVLRGDYLNAAAALVKRVADPDERADLAYRFDERAGICEFDGNMSRSQAERQAYIELAKSMEGGEACS
jgi:hypothetical protein